jgi:hypothetical protein
MRIMSANLQNGDKTTGAFGRNTFQVASEVMEKKGPGTRAFVGEVFNKLVLALTHRDVPDNLMTRYMNMSSGGTYTGVAEVTTPKEAIQAAVKILCESRITGWELEVLTPKRIIYVVFYKNVSFTARDP